eukprot:CAMPEP_0181222092 /NCGR_PEP_ID=MMETSP1096-20121128/29769_1 /TAXON_ID=156174 ORGANISM="Chrysochromulina ericina, Strain CCMP281" /NCGR_SAMPLE_ID=MMETSP1096 /ASSEMBLY_ACC=CAM_ASM_000453 /LENGTH=220 /DNA_ID=CAMNT_0023314805 /DNA_START=150 /DNA_END=813 /DNA_ORIENTATION=-
MSLLPGWSDQSLMLASLCSSAGSGLAVPAGSLPFKFAGWRCSFAGAWRCSSAGAAACLQARPETTPAKAIGRCLRLADADHDTARVIPGYLSVLVIVGVTLLERCLHYEARHGTGGAAAGLAADGSDAGMVERVPHPVGAHDDIGTHARRERVRGRVWSGVIEGADVRVAYTARLRDPARPKAKGPSGSTMTVTCRGDCTTGGEEACALSRAGLDAMILA